MAKEQQKTIRTMCQAAVTLVVIIGGVLTFVDHFVAKADEFNARILMLEQDVDNRLTRLEEQFLEVIESNEKVLEYLRSLEQSNAD